MICTIFRLIHPITKKQNIDSKSYELNGGYFFEISLNRQYSDNFLCVYNLPIGYILLYHHISSFLHKVFECTIS